METFFPPLLLAYLGPFHQVFSEPNWSYFQGFIWALLLIKGRKCVTKIAEACFFIDRPLSSFERFVAENKWDLTQVQTCLVKQLLKTL